MMKFLIFLAVIILIFKILKAILFQKKEGKRMLRPELKQRLQGFFTELMKEIQAQKSASSLSRHETFDLDALGLEEQTGVVTPPPLPQEDFDAEQVSSDVTKMAPQPEPRVSQRARGRTKKLRRAFIWYEIFSSPVALRDEER